MEKDQEGSSHSAVLKPELKPSYPETIHWATVYTFNLITMSGAILGAGTWLWIRKVSCLIF